jgi:LemA protein
MTQAGARSVTAPVTPAVLNDPAAFASYQAMQEQLDRSVHNLIGLAASYPQLQEDANFLDLRAQLTETQRRVAAARNRYIEAVRTFNTTLRTFPTDLTARMFDFRPMPDLPVGAADGK